MGANTRKQKVKIALIIGVFSLAVLVFALLLLEGMGTFAGRVLDRPVAASYINKNYKGLECDYVGSAVIKETATRLGITANKKAYRFEYVVESYSGEYTGIKAGDKFFIEVYNFGVINDGLYSEYIADRELLNAADNELLTNLGDFEPLKDAGVTANETYYDMCVYTGDFEGGLEDRLDALEDSGKIGDTDCVVHLVGEKVTFEEYKEKTAVVAEFFKENEQFKPGFLQIIYYYTNDGARVMQYESRLEFYEIDYSAEGIASGANMHYIVELDEAQATKAKIYNVVKIVYTSVVAITVLVLSAYWVVKKVRKLSRQEVVEYDGG